MSVRNIILTREYDYRTIYYDHWWNIPVPQPKHLRMLWREAELEEAYISWIERRGKLVNAVRNDPIVGNGSCSSINKYTDWELWDVIKYAKSEVEAVKLAREKGAL